jgi:hypothetical protein
LFYTGLLIVDVDSLANRFRRRSNCVCSSDFELAKEINTKSSQHLNHYSFEVTDDRIFYSKLTITIKSFYQNLEEKFV